MKTEFDGAVHALKRLLSDRRPDAVICVGQAAGRGSVTPEKVAINEAVELAKKFGGDGAPAFVNGILAKLVEERSE